MAKGKKKDKDKKGKKAKAALDQIGQAVEDTSKAAKKAAKKAKKEAAAKAAELAAGAQGLVSDAQEAVAKIAKPKHAAGHWPSPDETAGEETKPAQAGAKEQDAKPDQVAPAARVQAKPAPEPEPLEMPDEERLFSLANLFKIFSDPTRLRILYALAEGPKCVADISEAAGVTQGATSHQLRSMKQEHLVDFVRDGKQVIYSLADDRVEDLLRQGEAYLQQ